MSAQYPLLPAFLVVALAACSQPSQREKQEAATTTPAQTVTTPAEQAVPLPVPYDTKSVRNWVKVTGWPVGKTPTAPAGFTVTEYAGNLQSPRWIYVAPNGDVLVAESATIPKSLPMKVVAKLDLDKSKSLRSESANRLTLFRDVNGDGRPDVREAFLTGLNQPLGMLVLGNSFYVANTDGVLRFPYQAGATKISGAGEKILSLPAGGYNNHWTRNLLAAPDGQKIYVSVGSASNVMEHGAQEEIRRANILQINPDGTGEKVYASGLRNPVGMAWAPGTSTLWTAVNERDELGDELVPDYLTSVREGGFYGWPYAYFGPNEDPRRQGEKPDLVKQTLVPDVPLGAHTASLGLAFYDKTAFPARYHGGAFIGQHGSWNRATFSGYKVVFVPFTNGRPSGPPEDFLSGFLVGNGKEAYGRPVGVATLPDGSLLVADDSSGKLWRVSPAK